MTRFMFQVVNEREVVRPRSRIGNHPTNVYVLASVKDAHKAVEPWAPALTVIRVGINTDFADYILPEGTFALHAFLSIELGPPP